MTLSKEGKRLLFVVVAVTVAAVLLSPLDLPTDEYHVLSFKDSSHGDFGVLDNGDHKQTDTVDTTNQESKPIIKRMNRGNVELLEMRQFLNQMKHQNRLINRFNRMSSSTDVDEDLSCKHQVDVASQTESECYKLLYPRIANKRAWFFLGDSTMGLLYNSLRYPHDVSHHSHGPRCKFLEFANLPKVKKWKPPTVLQGPTGYGLENPGCSDVRASSADLQESISTDGDTHFFEKIVVDHAFDVTLQTPYTNSTQETIAIHMANRLHFRGLTHEDSVCVINSGLHDQKLCFNGNLSEDECLELYTTQVKYYLSKLYNVCGSMIWISTTPVKAPENPLWAQRNAREIIMNELAKDIMSTYENGFYFDNWDVASKSKHLDNCHFGKDFYQPMGELFASLM